MPNKLTDKEIVEAFEKLRKNQVDGYTTCLEYGGKRDLNHEKDLELFSNVFCLIKCLQEQLATYEARNKALRTERNRLNNAIDEQDIEIAQLYKRLDKAKIENERLFLENQKFLSIMLWGNKKDKKNLLKQIKAEAQKEFAERLKNYLRQQPKWSCRREKYDNVGFSYDDVFFGIDKVLKELEGEDNA